MEQLGLFLTPDFTNVRSISTFYNLIRWLFLLFVFAFFKDMKSKNTHVTWQFVIVILHITSGVKHILMQVCSVFKTMWYKNVLISNLMTLR